MLEVDRVVHPPDRSGWRSWLDEHRESRSHIWLAFWRAETGRRGISYAQAVEEALCFGWIDSVRKSLDERRWVQRFTPRRPGSPYSQANLERLAVLLEEGRVCGEVVASLGPIRPESFEIAPDILQALRGDPDTWRHWREFTPAYRRIRAAYVETARERGDAFHRRLHHLVEKTARGKQFGYGIERFFARP